MAIDLEKTLKEIADEGDKAGQTRAALFTLMVYTSNKKREAHFKSVIDKVLAKSPCRVIFICASEQEGLKTSVTTKPIGSNKIYCEIIELKFAKTQSPQIPFLILPQILSDLPVYLLWTEDPLKENSLFPEISSWASHILFDAHSTPNLCAFSHSLLLLCTQSKATITDLNWSQLSSWRHLLAQTFQDQEARDSLQGATKIKIQAEESGVEALYLHTWLAALFHWETLSSQGGNALYTTPSGELEVVHIPVETPSIQEIEITNDQDGAHYQLTHVKGGNVRVLFSDRVRCGLPVYDRLTLTDEADALRREFFYPSSKLHYLLMLQKLAKPAKCL